MAAAASESRVVLLNCGSFNPITFLHQRMFGKDAMFEEYNIFYFQLFVDHFPFPSSSSSLKILAFGLTFQKLLVMLCSKQVFIQWYKEYCLRLMMDIRRRLVNWKLQFNLLSTSFRFLLGFIDVLFSKSLPKTPDFSWLLSLNKLLLLVFK